MSIKKNCAELYYSPQRKDLIIFVVPVIVFLLYLFKVIPSYYYDLDMYLSIIIYSATIGYKYINPYISKVKGDVSNMLFSAAAVLLVSSAILFAMLTLLLGIKDPQNLKVLTNSLRHFLCIDIMTCIFVGIAEELLCFYILMIFLVVFKGKFKITISIILTASVFGALHSINWPLISVIFIAIPHIPFVYSYIKLKSILPAMFAHAVGDIYVLGNIVPGIGTWLYIVLCIILMYLFFKNIKKVMTFRDRILKSISFHS